MRNSGRPFDINDYIFDDSNPYRISPTYNKKDGVVAPKLPVVIDLLRWAPLK